MRAFEFSRRAVSISVAAALLSGCGGSQPPIGAPGAMPQTSALAAHADRGTSWMLPEAKSVDLLYVADNTRANGNYSQVLIFTYPEGIFVGRLTGFSDTVYGLCVDKTGDVFVADFDGQDVREYRHGGSEPIKTLSTNGSPFGCAVDPVSGDLAVMNWCDGPLGQCFSVGTVLIYKRARGTPQKYTDPYIGTPFYCTYDMKGNLYVDGLEDPFYTDRYNELPKGSSTFISLNLEKLPKAEAPGSILWDHGNLVVAPILAGNDVYRYLLSGDNGKRVGVIKLGGVPTNNGVLQFWIQGSNIIAPEVRGTPMKHGIGEVQFFNYPSGGDPTKTLDYLFYYPQSATVSPAS